MNDKAKATSKNSKSKDLQMEFDPNTIEHLGIKMYSTLPPVIAELVSNSYDADAENVIVELRNVDGKKSIEIQDDGHGMTFDQINDNFLRIGKNRRYTELGQKSESGKRLVVGKKGIGKLSFFGISKLIEIQTVRNNLRNTFILSWDDLEKAGKEKLPYKPTIINYNVKTKDSPGTNIRLTNLKRKSDFDVDNIAYNLAKKFSVFDEPDFEVLIEAINNKSKSTVIISNDLKYKNIEKEFEWSFPNPEGLALSEYEYADQIKGILIAGTDTVPTASEGIALFSRGKLVNEHEFYDIKATSFGYKYITGILDVSFIDDWEDDIISTNRKSLHWENDKAASLRKYLNELIPKIYNQHRKKQKSKKLKKIKEATGLDVDVWVGALPRLEKKLANSLISKIVETQGLNVNKAAELVSYVKDSFQFESFKEMAASMDEADTNDTGKIVSLLKEWQFIESREFYKISKMRIETIEKFEQHIDNNAREVPEMHEFFKTFPWILDPRIMNFQDEVTFSKLLRKRFNDIEDEESNRRIDFLCQNFAESFFIIELKRPQSTIGEKELDQALDYVSFIEDKLSTEFGKNIHCYIVCGGMSKNRKVRKIADSYRNSGHVYVKTYTDLLENAKQYHIEFINKYDEITSNQKE